MFTSSLWKDRSSVPNNLLWSGVQPTCTLRHIFEELESKTITSLNAKRAECGLGQIKRRFIAQHSLYTALNQTHGILRTFTNLGNVDKTAISCLIHFVTPKCTVQVYPRTFSVVQQSVVVWVREPFLVSLPVI